MGLTTDPDDPCIREKLENGQQACYLVLSEEERAKGFVRPVRRKYIHVGIRPKYPTRELTAEEHNRYDQFKYVVYEEYPPEAQIGLGRYWTQKQLDSGCNTETTMGQAIAETYARKPDYYGGTFCRHCENHFPVGEHGEFVWEDGSRVGT